MKNRNSTRTRFPIEALAVLVIPATLFVGLHAVFLDSVRVESGDLHIDILPVVEFFTVSIFISRTAALIARAPEIFKKYRK